MNQPNPYAPPEAPVADIGGPRPSLRPQRLTMGALVALQFVATLAYSGLYFELTKTGAVSFLAFLGAAVGNVCLYVATLLIVTGRARGLPAFAIATVLMASSLRGWGFSNALGWVIAFGALLAVCGVLLVRAMKVKT